jgi:predicted PurR-regulated permease PerM
MENTPSMEVKPRSISFYLVLAVASYAFIKAYWLLSPILLSFLLTLLISLAINPVILRIQALIRNRRLAAGLFTVGFIGSIVLAGWTMFGPMKESVVNLSSEIPEYWERIQKPLIKLDQQATLSKEKLQEEVFTEIVGEDKEKDKPASVEKSTEAAKIPDQGDTILSTIIGIFKDLLSSLAAMIFNVTQIFIVLVTVFFCVLFTIMNPRPIFGAILLYVPQRHHDQARILIQRIAEFAPKWAGAMLLDMASIGLLVFFFMWIIFGFSDALVLGIFAALMGAVPFLGPVLSAVPALLLSFGTGGMTPLWVLLAYVLIQGLQSNLLEPFIMARGMKLHPVAVIFAMLLSVLAFGVLGVLVAAPLIAIVDIFHEELYRKRYMTTITDEDLDDMAKKALREKM